MPTLPVDPNTETIALRMRNGRDGTPEPGMLQWMLGHSYAMSGRPLPFSAAGIDSSDNLLLRIPGHPGAGVAGYSFAISVSGPDGMERAWRDRSVEREAAGVPESLEIALVYTIPTRQERRLLLMADYQFRSLTTAVGGKSPYEDDENPPEFKLRLAAARSREITERRAIRTFLNQQTVPAPLFLKDGRLSSQSCSTRYMDDLGRLAVRRGVRLVGVVKEGTRLWDEIYPYHRQLARHHGGSSYWAQISPQLIWDVYAFPDQPTPKTIHLGARESQSMGGIGGLWVLYSPAPSTFFILEFNVYDLAEYRPLVESYCPLENHNRERFGWQYTYVVRWNEVSRDFEGTQMAAVSEDFEKLVVPMLEYVHHLATVTRVSRNYPVSLADAHNRCKITRERKDRKNAELIGELTRMGFQPLDFEK
jgi:hypothetical protein